MYIFNLTSKTCELNVSFKSCDNSNIYWLINNFFLSFKIKKKNNNDLSLLPYQKSYLPLVLTISWMTKS